MSFVRSMEDGTCVNRYVRAQFDYSAAEKAELSMREGDIITVLMEDKSGWWKGSLGGKVGLFPSNFTQPVDAAGAMRAMASAGEISHSSSPIAQTARKPSSTQSAAIAPTPFLGSTSVPTTEAELLAVINKNAAVSRDYTAIAQCISDKDWAALLDGLSNSSVSQFPFVASLIKDVLGPLAEAQGIAKAVLCLAATVIDMVNDVRVNNAQCQSMGRRLRDINPALTHLQSALNRKTARLMKLPACSPQTAQFKRDVESLKGPLQTLQVAAKAVQDEISEWTGKVPCETIVHTFL